MKDSIIDFAVSLEIFLPLIVTLILVTLLLWTVYWLVLGRHKDFGNERKFPRQLLILGCSIVGLLAITLVLPISEGSRHQLIGLIGILFSGVIAFSSATIVANLMAGLLLRITRRFAIGDFVQIGDYFGRLTERGLFDTEIQTEKRELLTLPNTYCINNPITKIRASGTIISASLSLGYEVQHSQVKPLLMEAAEKCGLIDTFVHITELGDFSVSYSVSGLLEETRHLISARSNLFTAILDVLHENKIEIMSAGYMNQRKLDDNYQAIPPESSEVVESAPSLSVEDIAFDKADQAESLDKEKSLLIQEIAGLESAMKLELVLEKKAQMKKNIDLKRERFAIVVKATELVNADEIIAGPDATLGVDTESVK